MARRATYHRDIPTWISHYSDVPCHNLGHILEHGSWSYSLTRNCSQDKIIILITTEKLVSETSHDLNLNLYLGIAPRARSWLRNMLCNISFVKLILSLIIIKQRVVLAHVLPHTYLGSTTLLFDTRLLSRTVRTRWIQTLLSSSSAFCEGQFFFVPGHPIGHTCGIGTSKKIRSQKFSILQSFFFKPSCKRCGFYEFCQSLLSINSCLVPDSGSMLKWVLPSRLLRGWRVLNASKGSWAIGHLSRMSLRRIS